MKYLDDLLLYAIKTDLSAPIQPKKDLLDSEKPWWGREEVFDERWVPPSDTLFIPEGTTHFTLGEANVSYVGANEKFVIYTDKKGKDIFDKAMEANVKNSTEE